MQGARKYGVIGGLGPLAGDDVFFKLMKAMPAPRDAADPEVIFAQRPLRSLAAGSAATTERKLHVFEMIRDFEKRGVTTVVLPCFLSHTFIDELKANTPLQIANMLEAIRDYVQREYPDARRIGVLTSDYVRKVRLFESYFSRPRFEIVHPRGQNGLDPVTEAVYGADGIRRGNLRGRPVDLLRKACNDLADQGAQVIIPGLTEIALAADEIGALRVPLIDSNLAYAQHVVSSPLDSPPPVFKLGVVGGVGPAATVDFLDKIVRNTPASRDQDHIKLLVEQNPQIPDRTEHLIGNGADPTISLYATCRKLEDGGADVIAIPCNTAHAFVDRIQPYLRIPIVNMLSVTVSHVRESFPDLRHVGVLATSGTIESGVYRAALESQGLRQVAPGPALQERVMQAIYGRHGIKAGFTTGQCREDVSAAIESLIAEGVEVILLGCTELPILFSCGEFVGRGGKRVQLVDPTEVLARRCVAYARGGAVLADFQGAAN